MLIMLVMIRILDVEGGAFKVLRYISAKNAFSGFKEVLEKIETLREPPKQNYFYLPSVATVNDLQGAHNKYF